MIRFHHQQGFAGCVLLLLWTGVAVEKFSVVAHTSLQMPAPVPAAPTSISTLPKPDPRYRFPLGETLIYDAEWRVFNAGIATLRMEQAGKEQRILGTADAIGAVALLYHVHDRFSSVFDPSTFCSRSIAKNIEEGYRKVDSSIVFDYPRAKAILDQKNVKKNDLRHAENDIPGCVTDVLSAIFYAGSLPLQPNKTYSFPLNDGGKTIAVELHVEAREMIKTPAGTFNTIRVQPETPMDLLKNKGKIWLWYSDDGSRIPIRMRGRMFWGTLTMTLQRIERQ